MPREVKPEAPELKAAYDRAFEALKVLGHSGKEARRRLERVREKLGQEEKGLDRPRTDGELVKLALRA